MSKHTDELELSERIELRRYCTAQAFTALVSSSPIHANEERLEKNRILRHGRILYELMLQIEKEEKALAETP